MSTYDSLDTLRKAILFHSIFTEDIPKLTAFINKMCEQDSTDTSFNSSKSRIKSKLNIYNNKILNDGQLFACLFFSQESLPFTVYCLKMYQINLDESCPLNIAINRLLLQTTADIA